MIHAELWARNGLGVGNGAQLCVPCLEDRIGRRLQPDDFSDVPADDLSWCKTDRLRAGWAGPWDPRSW